MPEGDSLRRAADRVGLLTGQVVAVETPHPRAAALGIAQRLDGRRLERVEATGKNLLLTFEGGIVLRSHLRMRGRWRVPSGRHAAERARPGSSYAASELEAVLWNGPVLALGRGPVDRLGPDVMDDPPDLDAMVARCRGTDQEREVGEACSTSGSSPGSGTCGGPRALARRISPVAAACGDLSDDELRRLLDETSLAMRSGRAARAVYRRAGRPCRPLRRNDPLAAAGRRRADHVLVSRLSGRNGAGHRVTDQRARGTALTVASPGPSRLLPRRVLRARTRARVGRRGSRRVRGARSSRTARRSTSTSRWSARSSRLARRGWERVTTLSTRSRRCATSRPPGSSPGPMRATGRARTRPFVARF